MNLIYANHGDPPAILAKILSEKALRGDEQNLNLLVLDRSQNSLLRLETLVSIDASSGHEIGKFAQLVCHERDQWRYNKDQTWHKLGRVLINK